MGVTFPQRLTPTPVVQTNAAASARPHPSALFGTGGYHLTTAGQMQSLSCLHTSGQFYTEGQSVQNVLDLCLEVSMLRSITGLHM